MPDRPKKRRPAVPADKEAGEGYGLHKPDAGRPEPEVTGLLQTPAKRPRRERASGESKGGPPPVRKKKKRRPVDGGPSLVSAIWYPLTGSGPAVLPAYAALLWMTGYIVFPIVQLIAALVVLAAVGVLFLEIANFTLEDIPSGPRFFEVSWESFSVGMFAMVAVLISRLPHVIGTWAMQSAGMVSPGVELLLIALGLYYLPMAIVALADLESESALNPLVVFRGIARMPGAYFGLVTVATVALLVPTLLMLVLPIPALVRDLLTPLLMLYVAAALIRAIALVYRHRGLSLARRRSRPAD